MNTTFYKKPNLAIEKLKLSLSNNLKEMQEIRKTMSDIDF